MLTNAVARLIDEYGGDVGSDKRLDSIAPASKCASVVMNGLLLTDIPEKYGTGL